MTKETPQLKSCLASIQVQYTRMRSPSVFESGGDFICGKCALRIPLAPTIAKTYELAFSQHRQKGLALFQNRGGCQNHPFTPKGVSSS